MAARPTRRPIRRVDVQVSILTAVIVVASCLCVFAFHYALTYNNMIGALTGRVYSIYDYLEDSLDKRSFFHLRSAEDMESGYYQSSRQTFANVKQATGVRYLYTATRNEDGDFIYLVDIARKKEIPLCYHGTSWTTIHGTPQDAHPHPCFTPDGSGVVFTSDREGKPCVYLAKTAGAAAKGE